MANQRCCQGYHNFLVCRVLLHQVFQQRQSFQALALIKELHGLLALGLVGCIPLRVGGRSVSVTWYVLRPGQCGDMLKSGIKIRAGKWWNLIKLPKS